MSRLSKMIDGAADGSESLTSLLRQVKVLGSRIGADELADWATKELLGYGVDDEVPAYRGPLSLPVVGTWAGFGGRRITNQPISSVGLDEGFRSGLFDRTMREPVAELEALATGDDDPGMMWDPFALTVYERKVASGEGGARIAMMNLVEARLVLPRTVLVGVLDAVRNQVLELALALERVSSDVGEPDGPTVADDAQVSRVAQHFNFTIYGDGTNIATGKKARQVSTVTKGDIEALTVAAQGIGLTPEAADKFREAILADGDEVGDNTGSFLDRVRAGTVDLVGNVSANIAASGLLELAGAYFGG